jgi:hypothetical protein
MAMTDPDRVKLQGASTPSLPVRTTGAQSAALETPSPLIGDAASTPRPQHRDVVEGRGQKKIKQDF